MTTFLSEPPSDIDMDAFLVKTPDDFGVITRGTDNPLDVGTILLYNCTELENIYAHGYNLSFGYKTFIQKPESYLDGGALFFQVTVDPPHNRQLHYSFPFDLWEPALMAFSLASQVLFLAGPRLRLEGEGLPEAWTKAGLDGVSSSLESLQEMLKNSLEAYGGLLVPIGPPTWMVVRMLYQNNALREMVKNPHPSLMN